MPAVNVITNKIERLFKISPFEITSSLCSFKYPDSQNVRKNPITKGNIKQLYKNSDIMPRALFRSSPILAPPSAFYRQKFNIFIAI